MFINASGLMGINTPTPKAGLDIRDSVYPSIYLGPSQSDSNIAKIYKSTAGDGSLNIDNQTHSGAGQYGFINIKSGAGTYFQSEGASTALSVKNEGNSNSIFRISQNAYDGSHGTMIGQHVTNIDIDAHLHLYEDGNDVNLLVRRSDGSTNAPGIELLSQASMSYIKTAASASNANSDLTISVGDVPFMYFDASHGGIRLGGGSSNTTPVAANTVQVSGTLDVMDDMTVNNGFTLGKSGTGGNAIFYGAGGSTDYMAWQNNLGSDGRGRLQLGQGTDMQWQGLTASTGNMNWYSASGILEVNKEIVLKDVVNSQDGNNVNFGRLRFGETGGFYFGELTIDGALSSGQVYAYGEKWAFKRSDVSSSTVFKIEETQTILTGNSVRPKISIGHGSAGHQKSTFSLYQPNAEAAAHINFTNNATGTSQTSYLGSTIGLDENSKTLKIRNYEASQPIVLMADDIVSSGIHRHLNGVAAYSGSAQSPAIQLRSGNQDIVGGFMNITREGDLGFASVTSSKCQGFFVSSSGSVSLGAGTDINGAGTIPKPRYTVDV
tara:strand:- start:8918 stop:10564 length:1647 start_codon:yes stop_codon:yes gene_type:complete